MTRTQESWIEARIGDVCQAGDGAHASIKRLSEGVPYLTSRNFKDGRLDLSKVDFISEKSFEKHFRENSKALTKPCADDVVFSIIGTIGEPYLVRPGDRFGISSSVAILRPPKNTLVPEYLFYWLRGPIFQSALYGIKGGVAQGYISLEMIKSLPIYYPKSDTQRRIAAILSAYDDLIENNTQRIRILEEMAQALYREWFVYFRFPGHEDVPLVESALGPIPSGWEWAELGNLADQIRDSVQPEEVDEQTPYVGLAHIPQKSIALSDWGQAGETKSTKLTFTKGDILFAKIRPYLHKVAVAPVDGVCSSDTIVIRPKSRNIYGLVLCCVSSEEFVACADTTSQGTQMPRANWDVLIEYPLVVPPETLLGQFNDLVQDSVAEIQNMISRNAVLREARDLLLPRLVSGEIDVSELEIELGELDNAGFD